jgi:DNA-binding transcriptional LysR family regulator
VVYLDEPHGADFISHKLYPTSPKIWCRHKHPIAEKSKLTLEDVCAYPKIAFHSPNISAKELRDILAALESADLNRDILLTTSHLLVALAMLANSNALMVAPDYLFKFPVFDIASHSIDYIPLFDNLKTIDVGILQHERTVNSPLHKWIVEQAQEVLS